MSQHSISYRKSLRSALRNKKLADAILNAIYDLQVFAAANGGTIASNILSADITVSNETPYELSATRKFGAESLSSYRKAFRSALNNRSLADNILNILVELQDYAEVSDKQSTSVVTIADGSVKEISDIACIAEGSVKEITDIETVADVADSLDGTYFILYDDAGSVAFWIDVDDSGTAEPAHGADRSVEITTIVTDDSKGTVGDKVYAAVTGDADFEAGSNDNNGNLTIQCATYGVRSDGTAGTSGFTVGENTPGVDSVLDGKYFIIHDDAGSVAVWIDVDDSGTAEPAHGADRSLEVTAINSGDAVGAVGTAVYNVLVGDADFEAGSDDLSGNLTVQCATYGARTNAADGDTGFTIGENTAGVDSALDGKYMLLEDTNGTVAFWIDVDDSGTAAPAHGADRAVEVTTITSAMTKAQVGDALYAKIIADSKFEAGSNDNAGNLVIQHVDTEYFANVSAGTSGFTVAISDYGSTAVDQAEIDDTAVTAQSSPFATDAKKALASSLAHAALADDIIDMIVELQEQFRDKQLGTCTGTLTNAILYS